MSWSKWVDRWRRRFGLSKPVTAKQPILDDDAFGLKKHLHELSKGTISEAAVARFMAMAEAAQSGTPIKPQFNVHFYAPPKGVVPEASKGIVAAHDAAFQGMINGEVINLLGSGFPGYPFLSELTQISEYRDLSERVANELTRKWIKFRSESKSGDKTERIKTIEKEFKRLKVRKLFRECAVKDGEFGRCQIFIDMGENKGPEIKTPLMLNKFKIPLKSIRALKLVEPISTYPAAYNAANPLAQDYYDPSSWFVYGSEVHKSRMLTFVSRPLPDILKPVFNFSGMSMSQLGMPYVDYWLSTRTNVGEILKNFRTMVLKTDMSDALSDQGSPKTLMNRLKIFAGGRNNFGVFAIDKDKEEEVNEIDTPLSGLKDLQAAAQEHMAAVAKTPLVVLLGISPSGLNASVDGEMRVFYDYVKDMQDILFRENLEHLMKVVMLSEFGFIDEDITFDFEPLVEMTEKERALIRKSDAEAGTTYIAGGVIDPMEERTRLATDPNSGYDNLNVNKIIKPPTPALVQKLDAKTNASSSAENGAREGAEMNAPDAKLKALDAILEAMEI